MSHMLFEYREMGGGIIMKLLSIPAKSRIRAWRNFAIGPGRLANKTNAIVRRAGAFRTYRSSLTLRVSITVVRTYMSAVCAR